MPTDTTPDPRDMERAPEAQQIPQARHPEESAEATPDVGERPPLPERPLITDEDLEADPTRAQADRGPGVAAGVGAPDSELNRD